MPLAWVLRSSHGIVQVQALLNGSTNSLSGLQGGSHQNLAGVSGRGMGPGPNSSPLRSGPSVNMDGPSALLSGGSQHLSASQLFSLVSLHIVLCNPCYHLLVLARPEKKCRSCLF